SSWLTSIGFFNHLSLSHCSVFKDRWLSRRLSTAETYLTTLTLASQQVITGFFARRLSTAELHLTILYKFLSTEFSVFFIFRIPAATAFSAATDMDNYIIPGSALSRGFHMF
ncbi:MAG: hypothetical protein ACYC21_15730, partial [Eubacteriales bacterium]